MMDNPEYTFQILEVFSKIKTKEIPRELEEYISYVARTGDPVFQWSLVKVLIKEKLLVVLDEFMEGNPNLEIPPCPNVDPFNFVTMKSNLLTRLDSFLLPPFTIQRLCELLSAPRKEYNRLDKYMRAVEKNVLVVSSSDMSSKRVMDTDSNDAVINGILYEKVDDSLNSVSNHVFSGEETDGELNISSKLDETDAVQQMIEETWTDENHDQFKLNGGSSTSALDVNFENELQFVTDKTCEDRNDSSTSTKEDSESTFDSNSMLLDSSLQNIIGENSNIAFENVSKSEESFESKNDDTYEFKSDSICESEPSSTSEAEIEEALDNNSEGTCLREDDHNNVSSTIEEANLNDVAETADVDQKCESDKEYSTLQEKTDEVAVEYHQKETVVETNAEYVSDANNEDRGAALTPDRSEENNELADVTNVVDENVEVQMNSTPDLSLPIDHENANLESKITDSSCMEGMEVDPTEQELNCGDSEHIQNIEETAQHEVGLVEIQNEQMRSDSTE